MQLMKITGKTPIIIIIYHDTFSLIAEKTNFILTSFHKN